MKKKYKVQRVLKAVNKFVLQTIKNYRTMKETIKKILVLVVCIIGICSCNVTRTMTTESHSYQKGDTAVHITTKTTETYNAVKNN